MLSWEHIIFCFIHVRVDLFGKLKFRFDYAFPLRTARLMRNQSMPSSYTLSNTAIVLVLAIFFVGPLKAKISLTLLGGIVVCVAIASAREQGHVRHWLICRIP